MHLAAKGVADMVCAVSEPRGVKTFVREARSLAKLGFHGESYSPPDSPAC
jgi:hypothetical protein